ncbi:EAL domain-containing protein [Clostridium ganghwense]|uniref:EAL domain-containing protein n=1 Tax=Clostridium ganghwense TaxID=312089 RepID=A0ABT4CKM4_9CLOT|nr:EAL domain-containing protein [Clostridium ganghwense]MCY6369587.1 EAL domain-containing protein [Clostridium ganghwense]
MKTYNAVYKDFHTLSNYVLENNIKDHDNILIQVFCGVINKEYIYKIKNDILNILPQAKIIGVTSPAEIFNGNSIIDSCIVSITVFNSTEINTYAISKDKLSDFQCGKTLAQKLVKENTKVLIIFGDGNSLDGEKFLEGINSVSKDIIVAGGLGGNIENKSEAYVFNESEILKDGAVGASLSGKELYVHVDNNFNWIPIGKEHTITKIKENIKENIIETIDDIPAREFYEKYIGSENINKISEVGIQFPIMVKRNGKYVSRPIKGLSENDGINVIASIKKGEKIRLGYGNFNYILKSSKKIFENIETKPIETVFIYSCIARKLFLKSYVDMEMNALSKDISVSGFFTFGEFHYLGNSNVFCTETMTLLGLSEEKNSRIGIDKSFDKLFKRYESGENFALYNLIKVTGDELNELNKTLEEKVEENTRELKEQYYTDQLTKLPNRNRLAIDIFKNNYTKLALIDVNSFTELNDFYGNRVGDVILIQLAKVIEYFAKENGFKAYRINSNAYALASSDKIKDIRFIEAMLKLQKNIKQQCFFYRQHKFFINVIIGIAIEDTQLIEKADMALNYAQKHQKNFQVYDDNLNILKSYENNLIWTKKISDAVENDRIVPYFQPIFNNTTGRIEKFESLIRMIDEDGQVISPYYFLDIAKKALIYNELTRIMISKTFKVFKNTHYEFSINLSVEDILDMQTRGFIIEKLSTSRIASQIIFEIVESEGIENFHEVMEFINEVKSYGAKVAIDDFGTGYSNFSYLLKLNVDYIKIDGSIIKNVNKDKSAEVVAETIVNFARKLGINTVAEFVSDKDIYKKINDMGIDFSQGYYFSEPKQYIK